jgi:hypothetical protein
MVAPGSGDGVGVALPASAQDPHPPPLSARTWNVYRVPLASPAMVHDVAVTGTKQPLEEGVDWTW